MGWANVLGVRTAEHLQHALWQFVILAEGAENRLNELNIFPVADSDTGTNVLRTAEAIAQEVGTDPASDLDKVAKDIGHAAMMASRGNSGLILGQYLAGFSSALVEDPWPEEWSTALKAGAAKARSAVSDPVEGTILSVADEVATAIGISSPEILTDASKKADAAVVQTEFQLPVLTKAGVVDAGGVALSLFVRALADVVSNEPEFTIIDRVIARPARRKGDTEPSVHREVIGYELQFNLAIGSADADEVQSLLSALGTDVVIATDGDTIAAHVHAADIGPVVEAVLPLKPFNIRIEALLESRPLGQNRA